MYRRRAQIPHAPPVRKRQVPVELGERLEDEPPLVHPRVRHLEAGLRDRLVAVEEQIEVDRPRSEPRAGAAVAAQLALDAEGNLYVAASYRGRRGVVRITPDGGEAELVVAGPNVVGLCFDAAGNMIVATGEAVYSLPLGVKGTLVK